MKKALSLLLVFSMLFAFFACSKQEESTGKSNAVQGGKTEESSVFEKITETATEVIITCLGDETEVCSVPPVFSNPCISSSPSASLVAADFALNLFARVCDTENVLVSPVSVILALCLAAEGADSETLTQMEKVLGTHIGDLRYLFGEFMGNHAEDEKMKIANSVWMNNQKNRLTVKENYIDICKERYSAEVFSEPFDESTLKKINNWVEKNTDGTIKNMLGIIPPHAVMYLINTVLFEADWQSQYLETQVREGSFTNSDGTKSTVEMMYSDEYSYFRLGKTQGMLKLYEGGDYAFAAMLPDEGVSLRDAAASFSGEDFLNAVTKPESCTVNVRLPKFEFESQLSLRETLALMGMGNAFDSSKADFTRMGTSSNGPLFIDEVYHKTFIKVAEKGTKAGAATAILMADSCAPFEQPKELYFDRPFIYAIIENESGMPVFFGCVTDFK